MQEIRLQHVSDLDVCPVKHQPRHGGSNGSSDEQNMASVGAARTGQQTDKSSADAGRKGNQSLSYRKSAQGEAGRK